MNDFDEQVSALGAWALALHAVHDLAHHGRDIREALPALMPSLLRFDRTHVRDYYECSAPLNEGLVLVAELFGREPDTDILKHGMQVLFLEKKLGKNRELMGILITRLNRLQRQAEHFSPAHDSVIAQAASIYRDTVGKAGARILVNGKPEHLQRTDIAEQIRALLLCAVRAGSLWRSYGGSRWQLMFSQRGVAEAALRLYQAQALR
ncbi:MAG: high frequency lysogenization protein HflD [Cardiobacteriaceae bacterium]|nr:high frequency lysogenization protein HflD [Cardiobacteriaceae bacterium]